MAERGTIRAIPEAEHRLPATPLEDLDAVLKELAARVDAWREVSIDDRIAILDACLDATLEVADDWAATDSRIKGIPSDSPLRGESWITGPLPTVRCLRQLAATLTDIRDTGRPRPPDVRLRPDGQVAVDVAPIDWGDRVALAGFTAEVRLDRAVTLDQAIARMGRIYRDGGEHEGGVALVLGAGNVGAIPSTDALYQLFALDQVVLLKMNPVNELIGPHLEQAFAPLVREGFLRVVYGGATEGSHLTAHELVDTIHITGSDRTHDVIVYGPGEEGARRKAADEPILDKPISSELGNVSPIIVVPGPWSDREVAFHGDNIASMLVQNSGFNCVAGRLIVNHRSWARRPALVDAVRDSLRGAEQRVPYYPGAEDRWSEYVAAHPDAERFGVEGPGLVPFTFITDLDADRDDLAFSTESFCGVIAEVGLDAPTSVPDYLERAVAFCNEDVWGTLAASIIVHPRSLADPEVARAVERAIDDLRYGSIVVNHWSGVAFGMMSTPWGAYPGHSRQDIGSGTGVVHNTFLLEDVEKTVIRGPFRLPLTPIWFHTNQRLDRVAPLATRFEATPDPRLLPRMIWHSLRG